MEKRCNNTIIFLSISFIFLISIISSILKQNLADVCNRKNKGSHIVFLAAHTKMVERFQNSQHEGVQLHVHFTCGMEAFES